MLLPEPCCFVPNEAGRGARILALGAADTSGALRSRTGARHHDNAVATWSPGDIPRVTASEWHLSFTLDDRCASFRAQFADEVIAECNRRVMLGVASAVHERRRPFARYGQERLER